MIEIKDMKQKGFAPIIILLAIVVLTGLGGVYYFSRQSDQTMPNPSPTQAPTQTSSNPTNSWETYASEKYGYTLKYPAQFTIKNAQELDYEMGGDTVYFVSKTKPTPTTKDVVLAIDPITKIGEQCDEVGDCEKNVSIFFNEWYSRLPEPQSELGKKTEIKIKNLTVNDHKAVEAESIGIFGNQTNNFFSRSIYIQKNATLIIGIRTVVYDEKDKATLGTMLDQILSTFRFTDKSTDTMGWKMYINTKYNYLVQYPADWDKIEGDNGNYVRFFKGTYNPNLPMPQTYISISSKPNLSKKPVRDWLIGENILPADNNISTHIGEKNITVGGVAGIQISTPVNGGQDTAYIPIDNQILQITTVFKDDAQEDYGTLVKIYSQILSTFHFTQ